MDGLIRNFLRSVDAEDKQQLLSIIEPTLKELFGYRYEAVTLNTKTTSDQMYMHEVLHVSWSWNQYSGNLLFTVKWHEITPLLDLRMAFKIREAVNAEVYNAILKGAFE